MSFSPDKPPASAPLAESVPAKELIMASVGTPEMTPFADDGTHPLMADAVHVDYYATRLIAQEREFKNAGPRSYVISAIDAKDKWSDKYYNCTGIAAVGRDAATGENISFFTHQDSLAFLDRKRNEFTDHLSASLQQLKERSVPGSMDIVVFGGSIGVLPASKRIPDGPQTYSSDYVDSIELIGALVRDATGLDAHVVIGPNAVLGGKQKILFDTKHRRLYLERDDQRENQNAEGLPALDRGGFFASQIREKVTEWVASADNKENTG